MNRRDTFKAIAGGLLGMMGVKAKPAQAVSMETAMRVDTSKFVAGMDRAARDMRVMVLIGTMTANEVRAMEALNDWAGE